MIGWFCPSSCGRSTAQTPHVLAADVDSSYQASQIVRDWRDFFDDGTDFGSPAGICRDDLAVVEPREFVVTTLRLD